MTRNAFASLITYVSGIFEQVSESCSDGCHIQDV